MAPLTADVIVDRARSLCCSSPFAFKESTSWESFNLQPSTNDDGVFRIPPPKSQSVLGGFAYAEDRTDVMEIWIARRTSGDYDAVRRALLKDVHSLTASVVRDGAVSSGDYDVPDGGRSHAIQEDRGLEFVTLRLTLPINYEAQL